MKNYTIKNRATVFISILLILAFAATSNAHFGSKGPYGGTITCSIVSADTVFVGTAEGGVYASTSPLLVGWRSRAVGLKSGKITALAHTGADLYAATADSGIYIWNGFDGSDRYFKKINNGLTNLKVTSLIAINATTLMAGTTTGLYLSTNKGATWAPVNGTLHHLDITAIVKSATRIFITTGEGGVYATDNNGTTWFDFNDVNTEHVSGTNVLSYNISTNELMVLNENGLYVVSSASTVTAPTYTLAMAGLQASYEIKDISNNGTSWYVATDHGVFTSAVATISWSSLNTGLGTLETTTIESFKTGLVAGTINKGIYKVTLPFTMWTQINAGFNNLKTTAMLTSGVAFVVAATERGVFVSKDLAANYVRANVGLADDSIRVNDLVLANGYLYAATDGGVYVSADSGALWSSASDGLILYDIEKIFYSNGKLYAFDVMGAIQQTPVNMIQWAALQSGLPSLVKPTSMAFYGNNILLGTFGHGVFVKTESQTTWLAYNTGLSNLNVTSVTSMGANIYVGTDGSGVFISDSAKAATNWMATAPTIIPHTTLMGLNGTKIQAMATYGGFVWASYKGGLLATYDQGVTWIQGGNQFNLPSYTDVKKITFVTTRVFVTTENNGLYSNALSEMPAIATSIFNTTSVNNALLKIAPNPSSGVFELHADQISGNITETVIYDYAGNVKGKFTGEQTQFHVDYKQGMYVVMVKTDLDAVYTQKIIIE